MRRECGTQRGTQGTWPANLLVFSSLRTTPQKRGADGAAARVTLRFAAAVPGVAGEDPGGACHRARTRREARGWATADEAFGKLSSGRRRRSHPRAAGRRARCRGAERPCRPPRPTCGRETGSRSLFACRPKIAAWKPGRSTGGSVAAVFVERLSSANSARRAVIYDPAFGPSVAPSPEPASTQRLCPPGECSMLPPPNRRTRPRMYVVNHVALLVADPKRRPVAPDSTVGKRTDRPTDDGIPTCVLQLDRA